MGKILVKNKKLGKEIKKTIVDLNIRKSDVGYLLKNLMFGYTKVDLIELLDRTDIPIAVQTFAHALLQDLKKGNATQTASMMQWAFDNTEKADNNKSNLTPDQVDAEINKLLTKMEL